jgi:hypothetical protein
VRRRGLKKSDCSPSCERPLKLQRHLVKLLAISNLITNGAEKIHCALGMEKGGVLVLVNDAKGFFANRKKKNVLAQIFHCAIGLEIFSKLSLSAIANDVKKGADRAVFAVGN